MKAIGLVMAANPIGLAALAIAGTAAVIWKNWEPIKGFFVGLWDTVTNAATWAWDGIKRAWLDYTPWG